jgi:hypothetical protein
VRPETGAPVWTNDGYSPPAYVVKRCMWPRFHLGRSSMDAEPLGSYYGPEVRFEEAA